MSAPSISTTGVVGPLSDVFSSSVSAYSAQQGIAPFSSLLQQAQTPPIAAPAPAPQPPPASPPQAPSPASTPGGTAANAADSAPPQDPSASSSNGRDQTAGGGTAGPGTSPASAVPTQPADSPNQGASASSSGAAMERREAPATSHAEKSGGRPTASSAKASERADGAVAGQTTAGTTVDAKSVAAAQAAQKGEQQQGHSHEDSKSSAPKDAANDPSQQSVPPVDPTAQVPVVAAVSEKGHSAGSQTQTSAPGANSTDVRVLKDSLPGVSQSQTTPKGSTSLGKSPVPTSKAAPTANSGGAATRAAGSSQSATGGFTGALTKATGEAALASQTTTATDGAGAGTGSTPRVQALATVSADGVQAVVTATGDTSKSSNTPSPPPSGSAAASSAAAATPTGTTTPNASAVGPSNGATYAANNSSQNPAGVGPSTVDRARFVQRVTRAFQTVGDQGGQIRLRLSPPELGSLDMQISVKDGGITAHIRADNSNARQLLLASLPDLRDRLAQQDIRIERFDVQLAGQSSGGMPQTPQDNPDFAQAGGRAGVGANSSTPSATADTSQAASGAITFTSGALNVVV